MKPLRWDDERLAGRWFGSLLIAAVLAGGTMSVTGCGLLVAAGAGAGAGYVAGNAEAEDEIEDEHDHDDDD